MSCFGRRLVTALALVTVTSQAWRASAAEVEPRAVFPRRARVEPAVADAPMVRVTLPAAVLAETRGDLADLRVIDDQGRFVPFALAPAEDPDARETIARSAPVTLAAVDRETDADGRPRRERLELAVAPPGFGFDRLVFQLAPGDLVVARASVWDLSEAAAPRELAHDAPLFRLPGRAGLAVAEAQTASIPVPPTHAARLAVEIRIEQGGWIAPARVTLERADLIQSERGEIELSVLATRTDDRVTVLDLERPAAIRPARLRLATTSRAFVREVRVRDVGGTELGRGVIARAPGSAIEALTVELARCACATGDLYVEIDDAGEGSLDELRAFAEVTLPSVVLTPTPGIVAHLYWGGGRVTLPSHRALDSFQAIAPRPLPNDEPAAAAPVPPSRWWTALSSARLEGSESNPLYRAEPAMAFALRAGAPLDVATWSHERALEVGPTPEGLAEWTLDAADLAAARADLADVRIVDEQDRQIASLLDEPRVAVSLAVTPRRDAAHAPPHRSHFHLDAPAGAVPVAAIEVQFQEGFFARNARVLEARAHPSERVLASTRLERRTAGAPFRIELGGAPRVASLILEIEDGDDPPLTPTSVTLALATRRVLFPAQPGLYRGLVGNTAATAPHYELASARELAVGLPVAEVRAGRLEPNPRYRRPSALSTNSGRTAVLWVALGVSVLALAGLTFKLVREPGTPSSSDRG